MRAALHYMYSSTYSLTQGEIVPWNDYERARILKLKCPCAGRRLSPLHLLPHIKIYGLADYLDMPKLKHFARLQAYYVCHVHWKSDQLQLKDALDLAFSNTPDHDMGMRRPLIDTLNAHPSLWVDDGEVRDWLNKHPGVLEKVDNGRDLPPYELTGG
jgi:hypothetical protein